MQGTLNFIGKARKGVNHTDDGFVYVQVWATGYQQIVFKSHEKAEEYAQINNLTTQNFSTKRQLVQPTY